MAKLKPIRGLDCLAPADQMIPLVLCAQLKAMCALRSKALDWQDPEGVHGMRVNSRRLRCAISDFKPYFRKSTLPRQKLGAIAKKLGAVRDDDVALAALEELKTQAQGLAAEGVELLAEERRQRRKDSRTALKKGIRPSIIADFRKEFLSQVQSAAIVLAKKADGKLANAEPAGASVVNFGRFGAAVISGRLKELCDLSPHIYLPFDNKELHELRILAKRLRYAVELFAACWGEEMEAIAKEIALLQTSLGELHDCDIWIDSLGSRLKQTARKSKNDEHDIRIREGTAWLLKHFTAERMDHYRDALTRWEQWVADGFLEKLKTFLDSEIQSGQETTPAEGSHVVESSVTSS